MPAAQRAALVCKPGGHLAVWGRIRGCGRAVGHRGSLRRAWLGPVGLLRARLACCAPRRMVRAATAIGLGWTWAPSGLPPSPHNHQPQPQPQPFLIIIICDSKRPNTCELSPPNTYFELAQCVPGLGISRNVSGLRFHRPLSLGPCPHPFPSVSCVASLHLSRE